MMDFVPFPKIARLSRDIVVTEKIDGTNAQVNIRLAGTNDLGFPDASHFEIGYDIQVTTPEGDNAFVRAGSRNRWIRIGEDGFGFASWVHDYAHELAGLGVGAHFGEWWGSGIQRGYGLQKGEKRFSLFNTHRWGASRPDCCGVVPTMYSGPFSTSVIEASVNALRSLGSVAAPGFTKPEGVVVFHTAANMYFKKTIEKDEEPKGQREAA